MNKIIPLTLMLIFLLTACAAPSYSEAVLLTPEGVTYDTAVARREDISSIAQYNAYVRSYTEEIYFIKSGMKIKTINVMAGDYVKEGDIIASLDTEEIDESISDQEAKIADMFIRNDFSCKLKEYDIQIAESELSGLQESKAEESKIEQKKYQVEKLKLEIKQLEETQRLDMERQYEILEGLNAQLEDTVVTAPFDGCVVFLEEIHPGNSVMPYKPLAYIADESRLHVSYSGNEFFRSSGILNITGQIEDRIYELKYAPMPMDELIKYMIEGVTAPSVFNFVNIDEHVSPGQFVSVKTVSASAENVITVPINSVYIGEAEEGTYVYVMENDKKILRTVETGIRTQSRAEIKSGLEEGEIVFVRQ